MINVIEIKTLNTEIYSTTKASLFFNCNLFFTEFLKATKTTWKKKTTIQAEGIFYGWEL